MRQLILNIEESRYALFVQFLKTLGYVKIAPSTESSLVAEKLNEPLFEPAPANQLAQLQQLLKQQRKPLFQQITDPTDWQKQQRNEWS